MTDEPPIDDPLGAGDPEAAERARRRERREAARRAREGRASLSERVSGALEGAAAKGRDAVEQGREKIAEQRSEPPEGPEPPPLRSGSPSRPWPTEEQRTPAPAEPVRSEPPRADPDPEPPRSERPAAPPFDSPRGGAGRPPRSPDPEAARRRRWGAGIAIALIVLATSGVIAMASRNGEPEPVPEGPRSLKTISVTIPEGLGRAEVAGVAKEAGVTGDYEKATDSAPRSFDIEKTGAPPDASLEGFLFPATYELEKGAPAEELVEKQLEAFDENIGQINLREAKRANLTTYDVVNIASMIEREVSVAKERPLVAAVIYNRLSDGEPLGIDATLRYEVGFDEPLTESQLEADSPYNTRIQGGLPPTPIGNPGFDSLEAAANPADVDFKYYVFKPGSCNEHNFTADYDEFLAAQAEYQAALEAEGGQPSDC